MSIFGRLFGSSKERTIEDIRRDQEAIRQKQLEEDERRRDEREAEKRREEEHSRRIKEEGARARALLVGSPFPEVAEALRLSVKIGTYGEYATLDAGVSRIKVNADGSGAIVSGNGWRKRFHLPGMTVAHAERLIREAARHPSKAEKPVGAPYGVTRH